jgi:hypothetical protein
MSRRVAIALLLATACGTHSVLIEVRDTERRVFTQRCERGLGGSHEGCEARYQLERGPDEPWPTHPSALVQRWRYAPDATHHLLVCESGPDFTNQRLKSAFQAEHPHLPRYSDRCRPIVCRDSADCGSVQYECRDGLCVNTVAPTRGQADGQDVTAICLAGTGPWMRTAEQWERILLVERDCPDSEHCAVPPECVHTSHLVSGR